MTEENKALSKLLPIIGVGYLISALLYFIMKLTTDTGINYFLLLAIFVALIAMPHLIIQTLQDKKRIIILGIVGAIISAVLLVDIQFKELIHIAVAMLISPFTMFALPTSLGICTGAAWKLHKMKKASD